MKINIPLYEKVYNELKSRIINDEFNIDSKLPSETELQNEFNVSRITIRKAVGMLQSAGYVKKYPGIGTVVKDNKQVIKIRNISGFSRDNIIYNPTSKLITFEKIVVPAKIQTYLEINPKSYVYKIKRLRFLDGEVVGLHISYVPVNIIELNKNNFSINNSSLYSIFNDSNIKINSADEVMEVRTGTEKINKLLEVSEKMSLLYIERTTYNEVKKPIEYVEIYYRTDKFKYQTKFRAER